MATATRSFLVDSHNVELLRQEVEDFHPDVVYISNLTGIGGVAMALAIELRGLPWVWRLGDAVPLRLTGFGAEWDSSFARVFTHLLTGSWTACSQAVLDEIAAGGGDLRGRVGVIADWIAGPRPASRDRWYSGEGTLHCLSAGQLAWEKGVQIAVEAIAQLRDEGYPDVVLDVVGAGPERFGLEAQVTRLGLGEQVRFHGKLSHTEVLRRYGAADVLVLPTASREPFGLVALEAAVHGCVPIVTAGCGITEWLVDGVHLITAPRDAASFAAVLRGVRTGQIDLAAIGRRAQALYPDFHVARAAALFEAELEAARTAPRAEDASWDDIMRMARIGETVAYRLLHPGS
jgi:glycosyltransferase involved in cell wall biosynthesis